MDSIHVIFDYLSGQAIWWGLLVLTASAMIEYVFPPFPGDTVTIAGAVLIPTASWPWYGVFAAVMSGSMLGSAFNWWIGDWIARHEGQDTWIHRFMQRESVAPKIDKLKGQFEQYGTIYIAANRFLPAFRSLFFVSAGLARLALPKVLFYAALSAGVWNAGLLGVGYLVGYNIDELVRIVRQYTNVVWVILGLLVFGWFVLKLVGRYRDSSDDGEHSE